MDNDNSNEFNPEKIRLPLGPDNVPPGSVFRLPESMVYSSWIAPSVVSSNTVSWPLQLGDRLLPYHITYEQLMNNGWWIKRPGEEWMPACMEV